MRTSIANIDREESFAARICDLLERHCPRLMVAGGGSLSQERPERHRTAFGKRFRCTTPEQDAEILRLAREGKLNGTEIARRVGVTQGVICRRLNVAGIRVPDGRIER